MGHLKVIEFVLFLLTNVSHALNCWKDTKQFLYSVHVYSDTGFVSIQLKFHCFINNFERDQLWFCLQKVALLKTLLSRSTLDLNRDESIQYG